MHAANQQQFYNSRPKARQGMSWVTEYALRPGQVIYRFFDFARCPSVRDNLSGPWWFEYEAFQQIKHFGERFNRTLGYSARLHGAVLYEWSEMDAYVRAEVVQPLIAWKGRGAQIHSACKDSRDQPTMTPMQSVHEVYQLYIPGLYPGCTLAGSALRSLEVRRAETAIRTHANLI